MHRARQVLFVCLGALYLLCLTPRARPAIAALVPGDYPTIQAALDAGETEVVLADGTYPETLQVRHDFNLEAENPVAWDDPLLGPVVGGMYIGIVQGPEAVDMTYVTARGIQFTGPVIQANESNIFELFTTTLDACLLEGGFTTTDGMPSYERGVTIRHCRVLGAVYANAYYQEFEDNIVVGCGITATAHGWIYVTGNTITGPAVAGINLTSSDGLQRVRGNTVRYAQDGIIVNIGLVDSNLVEDCDGTAYTSTSSGISTHNVARRCGGHGFQVAGIMRTIQGNTVDSVGLCGIHATNATDVVVRGNTISRTASHGIWCEGGWTMDGIVAANVVLNSKGDGIRCALAAESNVVGRCGGRGIVAASAQHNTSYLNFRAGLEVVGDAWGMASITHNIAYWNLGYGLVWSGTGVPVLSCNDWYGNGAGAVVGVAPGPTDVSLPPVFCDLANDNVHLGAYSPLLSLGDCGLVGALGQGCMVVDVPLSVEAPTLAFAVNPNPSKGAVQFLWAETAKPEHIDVYDIFGARRWGRAVDEARTFLPWDGIDQAGRRLPAGVYYARLTGRGVSMTARFVLVR